MSSECTPYAEHRPSAVSPVGEGLLDFEDAQGPHTERTLARFFRTVRKTLNSLGIQRAFIV
jgi:hypothetical protein